MSQTAAAAAITRDAIESTYAAIRPHIRVTPTLDVHAADLGLDGPPVTLKLELLQLAGSFKTRGAFANLLTHAVPAAGVVAASGGNHGAAVAYAAMRRGVPARIFVPTVSSPAKVERIRSFGADLVITGAGYSDAFAASQEWAAATGALSIHAFDQVETLLGQGTLGLELSRQAPDLDTVLIAVGGGGLIGGVAAWYGNRMRVIGVEPESAPTLTAALAAGRPVDAPVGGIAADSLAPRQVGALVYPLAAAFVSRVVLVADDDIRRAQHALWDRVRLAVEPGGSAAFAALLSGAYRRAAGERVGIVVSGGNTVLTQVVP
jgi:threonine dehydratase